MMAWNANSGSNTSADPDPRPGDDANSRPETSAEPRGSDGHSNRSDRAESDFAAGERVTVDLEARRLEEIEARANAATCGPWEIASYVAGRVWTALYAPKAKVPPGRYLFPYGSFRNQHDAEFIVHAREDIPALVGEVRALRAAILELTDERDDLYAANRALRAQHDAALAEINASIEDYTQAAPNRVNQTGYYALHAIRRALLGGGGSE